MMDVALWIDFFLATGPIFVALAAYELIVARRLRRRVAELEILCDGLSNSIARATSLSARLVTAERRIRDELRRLGERLGQLELRSDSRAYEQAINLAKRGERADQLVSCFGLAEAEANLVSLLHGDRPR